MTTMMIFAAAVALGMAVLSGVVFKIHAKYRNNRIIRKIGDGNYCFDELNRLYQKAVSGINKGSKFYLTLIALFVGADAVNYYVSFDSIYRTQPYMLIILVLTLAIVLDHAPTAISEYLFSDEKLKGISQTNRKIIKVIMTLLIAVILSFIVMLFVMRWSTTDIVFEDSEASQSAQNAMVVLWSMLALGTTLASFLYSTINTLILAPRMLKTLNRETAVLGEALLANLEGQEIELRKYAQREKSESELTHDANVEKIKAEHALLVSMYQSSAAQRAPVNNESSAMRQAV